MSSAASRLSISADVTRAVSREADDHAHSLPFVIVVAAGLIIGSSYCWARRQGLLAAGSAAELSQRWSGLGGWCAGALAYALPRWGLGLGWP